MNPARFLRFSIAALLLACIVAFAFGMVGAFVHPEVASAFAWLGFGGSLVRSYAPMIAPGLSGIGAVFAQDFMPGVPMTSAERTLYAQAMATQRARGLNPIMTPGYIRSEAVLPAITTGWSFAIRADQTFNGQAIQLQEQRLDINDAFYILGISVMFYQFVTATANPARVRAALQTFPNNKVFTTNAVEVEAMYNGKFALKVDNTTYLRALDMNAFRYVASQEQGLAASSVATTGVVSNNPWEQDKMFRPITTPLIRLNGSGRNEFTVTCPDTITTTTVALNSTCAVLYLRGWSADNGGSMRPGQA